MSSTQDSTTTLSATSDASSATLGTNPNVEKALVSLEDDDEFEDFPVEGEYSFIYLLLYTIVVLFPQLN